MAARTTSTIRELSHSRTSEPCRPTTRESMAPNPSCAESVPRLSLSKEIGGLTRRTVASCGIALVVQISSTRDPSRIILGHSERVTNPILLLKVLRRTRKKMKLLLLTHNLTHSLGVCCQIYTCWIYITEFDSKHLKNLIYFESLPLVLLLRGLFLSLCSVTKSSLEWKCWGVTIGIGLLGSTCWVMTSS